MKKNDSKFGYRLLRGILLPVFKLYYNPKIYGAENIPSEGNILICGNHKHIMDQCMPIMGTKRTIHWMAKREYFDDWKVAWFFKMSGCIRVDRSIHDEEAKGEALEVLKTGGAVGLFPEGTRNKTTDQFLLPFKFGAVSMAKKTNSRIVPFGISGDYKFRSKNLRVVIGKPINIEKMDLEEANKKLEKEIGKLIRKGQAMD
ncbi:MAG: 1-acyl-sn-glycerol-3-phosphate acyltransferase [Firmicutes bacterium]|nr:1-acyl-sn-glycerol-3-phosphate acyltransferase [Bacillota bacterium]